jgi:hypothetical protein
VPPYNYAHHRAVTAESLNTKRDADEGLLADLDVNAMAAQTIE